MMNKRMIVTALLVLTLAVPAIAQDLKNKAELSLGIGFSIPTESALINDISSPIISFPLRVGYFITGGLEVEMEAMFSLFDDGGWYTVDAGMAPSINASYNFAFGRKKRFRPFVLAGVGRSLAQHSYVGIVSRTAINLGAGFKAMMGRHSAFRLEYRRQSEISLWGSKGFNSQDVRMGFSFFL